MAFPIRHSIQIVVTLAMTTLLMTGCGHSTEVATMKTTAAREQPTAEEVERVIEGRQRRDDLNIRGKYDWLHELGRPSNLDELRESLPFVMVQLERTTCFGTCPAYTVTFHRDGKAVYEGREYAERKGRYVASVHPRSFGRLCCFIELMHFEKLDTDYMTPATDLSSTHVTVDSGTHSKTVTDYGVAAPVELWALEELIDSIAEKTEWRKEE